MQLVASQEEEGMGAGWWEGRKTERERTLPAHTQERSCEDIARRQSSASQEDRSHAGLKWPPP